ncbi:RNHCP domain-containing protein [Oceanobacillus sp. FSL W8-0428]|uniref:RNHCP domain-containing protein n=1 Tax=Oceanobacillus TaxID=182709 RepID=UPI000AB2F65C|nr:RNHCP domain-containing protein [Oceanobacillus sojae]
MSKITENTAFQCEHCGANVAAVTNGSFRNHCPFCLYSKHLDNEPGDRLSTCRGVMRPIQIDYSGKKGYQIIHECNKCGKRQRNKAAINTIQEDDILRFVKAFNQY